MSNSTYMKMARRTRREVLRGGVAAAFGGLLVACGAKKPATTTTTTPAATTPATTAPTVGDTAAPSATQASTASTASTEAAGTTAASSASAGTTAPAGTASATGTAALAAGQQVSIKFTFAASGGRVKNPYIAVWVADQAGKIVRTVGLSVNTSGKGMQYLRELKAWYTADLDRLQADNGAAMVAMASPTRLPGAWEFAWDGNNDDGQAVAAGAYTMYIEAAREHGPYEVISQPLTLDGTPFNLTPADNGELTGVSLVLA